jgi:hypothetical protein
MKRSLLILVVGITAWQCCAVASVLTERGQLKYDDRGRRDPFLPLIGNDIAVTQVAYLKSVDDLIIEGILMDPKKGSVVIVNGQVLKEGNYIGGFRIDSITANKVIFSREDKSYTVNYGDVDGGNASESYKSMFADVPASDL